MPSAPATPPTPATGGPLRVCFVCTGNICRSPMADVVLRSMASQAGLTNGAVLADHLDVSSAGTSGWHQGDPMDPRARSALERRGYADHGHRARQFDLRWFDTTDMVVCLDRGHHQTLLSLGRSRAGDERFDDHLVMLRSYDPRRGGGVDVPDPYYGDDTDFEECLTLVERSCGGLVEHLRTWW